MGIGNAIKGHKFPTDKISLKGISLNKEEEKIWKLCMNSHMTIKCKIFEEEENKIKQYSKKISNNSLISVDVSSNISIKSNLNAKNKIEESSVTQNVNNTKNIQFDSPNKGCVKSLINMFERNSINSRNTTVKRIGKMNDSFSKDKLNNTMIEIDTISLNTINPVKGDQSKKRSLICLPSHNKEKYRREMASLYSDMNECEFDLNESTRTTSATVATAHVENYPPHIKKEASSSFVSSNSNNSDKLKTENNFINTNTSVNFLKSRSTFVKEEPKKLSIDDTNDTFLRSQEYVLSELEKDAPDSFCEAFFLAGLPFNNAKAIDESEHFLSPCKHKNCSLLPAYKPEILSRYPTKDSSKLELNSLLASICFPLGIKLCYSTNESEVHTRKNYSTSIINQDGSKFYLVIYNFYVKYENPKFQKMYEMNPVKEFLHLEKILPLIENNKDLKKKLEAQLEKQLEICTQFNFNELVYVPFVACLISRNPYINQIEKSLQVIVNSITQEKANNDEITQFILHLTKEIPIPSNNNKLQFFIPSIPEPLQIIGNNYKEMPIINERLWTILYTFSIENIITIHHLMLLEQKILFIGNEYKQISEVIECFASLLYPLQWIHTYIPILTEEMVKYLQSFMPFVMGIDESLLSHARPYFSEEDSIFLVYINQDKIDISSNRKGKKLKRREFIKIPEFPVELEKTISKKLGEIKKVIDKYKGNKNEVSLLACDICIREIFTQNFIKMFGDYAKYNAVIDDVPVFNAESFVSTRPVENSKFYFELTETQLFSQFLQSDVKEQFAFFYKLNERFIGNRRTSISGRRSTSLMPEEKDTNYKDVILNCALNKNTSSNLKTNSRSETISQNGQISLLERITTYNNSSFYVIPPSHISYLFNCKNSKEKFHILKESERVFNSISILNFDNLPNKVNRFYFPGENKRVVQVNNTKKANSIMSKVANFEQKIEQNKKNKIFLKGAQKLEQLTQSEKEELKTILNDYLRMIFTSEKLTPENKKTLDSILKKPFGRDLFSKCIFQSKFKEKQDHCLSKESFDDLFELIFHSLLLEGEDLSSLTQVRLLIISTFHYYKINGKSHIYIYQELNNKKGTFAIFKKEKFWSNWLLLDKKEASKSSLSDEEVTFNLLVNISRTMNILNLECKFILNCLVDEIAKHHIKSEKLLNELNIVILKQAKNISHINF